MKKLIHILSEYSIPLLAGLAVALFWANLDYDSYNNFVKTPMVHGVKIFGYSLTIQFLINDIFMVFFFGLATVEIVHSFLPGGSLFPVSKSINPIIGTVGGIFGPILVFFLLCNFIPLGSLEGLRVDMKNGWGIPTATDIALAWMVMKMLFGSGHPAVSYLLLLAVIDDAVGLFIIAIFYPNPLKPFEPAYLGLILLAVLLAVIFRKFKLKSFVPYIFICGFLAWCGLILANLHPALALVCVVPFLPYDKESNTLIKFEHKFKLFVDIGLFGFTLVNAGVLFSSINALTFIILVSLIVGKTIGIVVCGFISDRLGYPLPKGMNYLSLTTLAIIAGLGLTVSLFITGEAYTNLQLLNGAKMGALLSIFAAPLAWLIYKLFKVR